MSNSIQLKNPSLFRQQAYINGQWCNAQSNTTIDVMNPATSTILGNIPNMGASETEEAIKAADAALPLWKAKTAKERSQLLRRWHDLILENKEDLAMIMTVEQGKSLTEAQGEIGYAASFIEWFAEEAKRVYGDTIPSPSATSKLIVTKEAIGVCAAITPWNFPSAMITRKVGPALAAGCTMVVKPAELTPYSAFALAVLAEEAGIPKGVLNFVTGDPKVIGGVLTASPVVRKLTFTGSTPVGKLLMAQSANTIKKVSLELGGNAPFIVFDDADLDAAVEGVMVSKFRNSGQTCVCANRIYVQESIYDAFVDKLVVAVKKLKVGNGLEQGVNQGPLINEQAVQKVEKHIADATQKGATVVVGGKRHALGHTFFEPTILTQVTSDMQVATEETFGPLAPVFAFKTEEDVITMANSTEFGLASYFFSNDISRVWRVADALESGMVGINTGLISNEVAPFGGVKQSGLGREGSHYGIDDYVVVKYLCMGIIKKS